MTVPLLNEPASPDPFNRDREWLFREQELIVYGTSEPSLYLFECQRCGALVKDDRLHARFHGVEGEYLTL